MSSAIFTRLMHSRAFGTGIGLLSLLACIFYFFGGYSTPLEGDKGFALPSADLWIRPGLGDFCAGMASLGITTAIMVMFNKVYNVLRSMSWLYIALFGMMMAATPNLATQFYTGSVLTVVAPACLFLLFSCFKQPGQTRHIFLIFLMLSLLTATQYCFAVYIPVFMTGLAQMRVFNLRSVTAAMLGIITASWLLLGFGIIAPDSIRMPSFVSIFSEIELDDTYMLLITVGVTTFAMLACYILNLLKTIAYNAQARAYNGAFTLLALVTAVAMSIDYRNIISYVPLLNFSAAMEITHYFSTHRAEKSFIAIYLLIAVYAALFVCQTLI